jgi:hypothetical protein
LQAATISRNAVVLPLPANPLSPVIRSLVRSTAATTAPKSDAATHQQSNTNIKQFSACAPLFPLTDRRPKPG